jgi:GntR family transcriptional regulator
MQFSQSQAIYLQIADYVCEKILLGEWPPEQRILSVRELAIQLEVNPNTVMRAYEFLQQENIIYNQRGIGFFAAADAPDQAARYRRQVFMEKDLPLLYRNLYLLGIDPDHLKPGFENYKKQNFFSNEKK